MMTSTRSAIGCRTSHLMLATRFSRRTTPGGTCRWNGLRITIRRPRITRGRAGGTTGLRGLRPEEWGSGADVRSQVSIHHRVTETQRESKIFHNETRESFTYLSPVRTLDFALPFPVPQCVSRKFPYSALVPQVRVRSLDANLGISHCLAISTAALRAFSSSTASGHTHFELCGEK